jgi:hypothetical protein
VPSFSETVSNATEWGYARGIIQRGTALGQAIKTLEEVTELLDAINTKDINETRDALGDIMVTMVMVSAILGVNLERCFAGAYEVIKDRTGTLRADGVFVKDAA